MARNININNALAACKHQSGDAAKMLFDALDLKVKELGIKPGRTHASRGEATESNVNIRSILLFIESVVKPADDADEETQQKYAEDCSALCRMHATLGMRL